MAFGEYLE
jgi:elongator complex protein 1